MSTIKRSRLKELSIEQVISISTSQILKGNTEKWARVRRMWGELHHGQGNRAECETQLAWAMGYLMIAENVEGTVPR